MEFFATAAKGTEPALRDELRELRTPAVKCDRGGVHFGGAWRDAFHVCLHTRIALRVLRPLASFPSRNADELYQGVRTIDWSAVVTPRHTLAVSAFCRGSLLAHSTFVSQKVKDAVVDQIRDRCGARPDVAREDPDLCLFVHLVKNQATVYLDLVGESLHRRGYRQGTREAPLKENLAAALLRLSGWDREAPLCDPMCGAGTIPIEAALWARDISPGLSRKRFGFERWVSHDAAARRTMAELREEARSRVRKVGPPISGSDINDAAVQIARRNARAAGVEVAFSRRNVMSLTPLEPPGFIVTNPPYGKRLSADRDFYREMGEVFTTMRGHTVCVLTSHRGMQRSIPMKPRRFQIVYNGDIECRLVVYQVR